MSVLEMYLLAAFHSLYLSLSLHHTHGLTRSHFLSLTHSCCISLSLSLTGPSHGLLSPGGQEEVGGGGGAGKGGKSDLQHATIL